MSAMLFLFRCRLLMCCCAILLYAPFYSGTLFAQTGFNPEFGRLKPQHESFQWQSFQTKHFEVYFHGEGEYIGRYTAQILEESLATIERTLGLLMSKRIPVIVYNSHNQFQQTNAVGTILPRGVSGLTESMKNRIVVPFEGNWNAFRHVLFHELVHACMNDFFFGGTIQSAVSGNMRMEFPTWLSEGLAEYISLQGLDVQTDMFMRDRTVSGAIPDLHRLAGLEQYRIGQMFWWLVAERFGNAKIIELLARLRNINTLDNAFRSTFGVNVKEMSEVFREEMSKLYSKESEQFEDIEKFSRRLTQHTAAHTVYNSSPALSPDGATAAFISGRGGQYGIYTMDIATGTTDELIRSGRGVDFEELTLLTPALSWNAQSTHIAATAKSGGADAVYLINVRTGDKEKLPVSFKTISSVAWSPDGQRLALTVVDGIQSDIVIYDVSSQRISKLTDDIFGEYAMVWSPDSKTIFFVSDRGEHLGDGKKTTDFNIWEHDVAQSDVYAIDIETLEMQRITAQSGTRITSLAMGQDATKLYVVSDENGIGNIYEWDLTTKTHLAKTNSLSAIKHISIASDGLRMICSALKQGSDDIFLIADITALSPGNVLEPTGLRKKERERSSLAEKIVQSMSSATPKPDNPLTGYGVFDLDFTRQRAIVPNAKNSVSTADDARQTATANVLVNASELQPQQYVPRLSTDILLSNPTFNTFWGLQLGFQSQFSDMLGDHVLTVNANVLFNLRNLDIMATYSYLPNVIDYEASAFYTNRWAGTLEGTLSLRFFGAGAKAIMPLTQSKRIEAGANIVNVSYDNLDFPFLPSYSRFLIIPEVKFTHDDAQYAFGAPVSGTRYTVIADALPALTDGAYQFARIRFDGRAYLPVGEAVILAGRAAGGGHFGGNPLRFFVGGAENWFNTELMNGVLPFRRPEDLYFNNFVMPLRGWALNQLSGTKFFAFNGEVRIPAAGLFGRSALPSFVQSLVGTVFTDIGGAWTDTFQATAQDPFGGAIPGNLLTSAGIGLRALMFGLPLKVDVAWANLVARWSEPRWVISLGYDF